MAEKNLERAVEPVIAPTEPTAFPLTLEEFCSRLSSSDRRVELIGGFAHVETRAGRMKDLEAAYLLRFTAFVSQPA